MKKDDSEECCRKFELAPWDEKKLVWENKRFVKDHVTSIFHIPLNFGAAMKRNVGMIEAANAKSETMIVLSDEKSLWSSDVYIEVTKDISGANMATISGTFLSKVFEGPYSNLGKWVGQMKEYVKSRSNVARKLFFFYTTCPKCAKKFGKNYVVILAQIR